MSISNTAQTYGLLARALHWITAALILIMIPLGFVADNASHAINAAGATPTQADLDQVIFLFSLHKTLGVVSFVTALIRLIWMLTQTKPVPLHPARRVETFLGELVHFALYFALVLVPLTGWIHHAASTGFAPIWGIGQSLPFVPKDAGVAAIFGALHLIAVWILIISLGLHIAGALKHHLIDRDSTLSRMTRGTAAGEGAHGSVALPLVTALVIWGLVPVGVIAGGLFKSEAPATPALQQVASDWQVSDGRLGIAITQMGNRVEGQFSDWTAQISFADDAAQEKNGEVTVTVSIPSLALGTVAQQAMGPDYFDATAFPTAVFTADILRDEAGFVAQGTLTIKDQTVPLSLPFTLTQDGAQATASGTTRTNRLDFGVGAGMKDEGTLAFEVEITFDLVATKG